MCFCTRSCHSKKLHLTKSKKYIYTNNQSDRYCWKFFSLRRKISSSMSEKLKKVLRFSKKCFSCKLWTKRSYWLVECGFDDRAQNFLTDGQKFFAQCPKKIKEFEWNFSLKIFVLTRKMQFWQPCRKIFAERTKKFCSMSQNDDREKFNEIFSSKCCYWHVECNFLKPTQEFLPKAPRTSTQCPIMTKRKLLFSKERFFSNFLYTHRMQIRRRAKKFERKTDKFSPMSRFDQKIINFSTKEPLKLFSCIRWMQFCIRWMLAGSVFLEGEKLLKIQ